MSPDGRDHTTNAGPPEASWLLLGRPTRPTPWASAFHPVGPGLWWRGRSGPDRVARTSGLPLPPQATNMKPASLPKDLVQKCHACITLSEGAIPPTSLIRRISTRRNLIICGMFPDMLMLIKSAVAARRVLIALAVGAVVVVALGVLGSSLWLLLLVPLALGLAVARREEKANLKLIVAMLLATDMLATGFCRLGRAHSPEAPPSRDRPSWEKIPPNGSHSSCQNGGRCRRRRSRHSDRPRVGERGQRWPAWHDWRSPDAAGAQPQRCAIGAERAGAHR